MKNDNSIKFGKDFVWGVATAAFQIEGAYNSDGKGLSVWDVFSHREGKIKDSTDADVACDSYNRVEEDVKLLADLGVNAYRFSVAWSRVLPDGVGKINEKGVGYYNKLINLLRENNITPYLTLYHWDLPQSLHEKGGFLNPEFPKWFEYYASVIVEKFGDRVRHFFTFNEPQCIFGLGYNLGIHAPGLQVSLKEQLQAVHNMLLAHGLAVKQIRKIKDSRVTYASCGGVPMPETDNPVDYRTARDVFFDFDEKNPVGSVVLYSDPIFTGKYPEKYYRVYKDIMPNISAEDMEIISQPVDFFAQNTYEGVYIKAKRDAKGTPIGGHDFVPFKKGSQMTPMGWHVVPECLQYVIRYLYDRYQKEVYITENGTSCWDFVYSDGKVHDRCRCEFLTTYLKEMEKAMSKGAVVGGYFHWSLMDNFEWAEGYSQRFGLVYVDFETLKRIPKDGFYHYKDIIKNSK